MRNFLGMTAVSINFIQYQNRFILFSFVDLAIINNFRKLLTTLNSLLILENK